MAWRISYWRGPTRLRVTTVENATQEDVETILQRLAAKQMDLEYLRASEADTPQNPEVHSNRNGTMLWTIGKDFRYTADWFADGDSNKRKHRR
jgi:hypothetical protein